MEHIKLPQPEQSILNSLEKQVALAHKLQSVYDNRPEIDSFVGVMAETKFADAYTKEAIEKDEVWATKTRNAIDEQNSSFGRANLDRIEGGFQLSEIMQAMIVDRMNKHWFKECKTVMTSDYDDLSVGIDAVMKHEKGGYLGAAFDFTVTNQDKVVYEKLKKDWDKNVKDGKIPTVKYFEDPDTKEKGRLLVPKFVIGASKKDVEDIAQAYLADDIVTLDNHPFKYVMLMQIEEQLQTVLDYYESNENESLSFAKKQYERIQGILRSMRAEIHADEQMDKIELYEYTKTNIALETMRRFRILKENKEKEE